MLESVGRSSGAHWSGEEGRLCQRAVLFLVPEAGLFQGLDESTGGRGPCCLLWGGDTCSQSVTSYWENFKNFIEGTQHMVSLESTKAQAGSRAGTDSVIHAVNCRQSAVFPTLETARRIGQRPLPLES